MLLDIYLFLSSTAIIFVILSFFRRDIIAFAWFAALLCPIVALISGSIETSYCTYGVEWNCYVARYESVSLMWLWFGIGFFMIAYAIAISLWHVERIGEEMGKIEER